jgi:hypothetical protein
LDAGPFIVLRSETASNRFGYERSGSRRLCGHVSLRIAQQLCRAARGLVGTLRGIRKTAQIQ